MRMTSLRMQAVMATRGFVAGGGVEPLPVAKDFDPFKDGRRGFGSCHKPTAMDQFAFEAVPEAFPAGIIMAVARPHSAGDAATQIIIVNLCKPPGV